MIYNIGTVELLSNGRFLGTGTEWLANASVGNFISISNDEQTVYHKISSIISDTIIDTDNSLFTPVPAGANYSIITDYTTGGLPLIENGETVQTNSSISKTFLKLEGSVNEPYNHSVNLVDYAGSDFTVGLADENNTILLKNVAPITITIPTISPFETGSRFYFIRMNAGVIFAGGPLVFTRWPLTINAIGGYAMLIYLGGNRYSLSGSGFVP